MDALINLSSDEVEEQAGGASVEVPATVSKKTKEASKLKPILSGKPVKRQHKLNSAIWDDFEMIDDLDVNGNIQCKCKRCRLNTLLKVVMGRGI